MSSRTVRVVLASALATIATVGAVLASTSQPASADSVGLTWGAVSQATPNQINAMTCTSPTFCVAVDRKGFANTWNGTAWGTATEIVTNGYFEGVSCVSSSYCVAVTAGKNTRIWNGTSWNAGPNVNTPGTPSGISCPSVTMCVQVDSTGSGPYSGYGSVFNGTAWAAPVKVDQNNYMLSVSCPTTTFCKGIDGDGYSDDFNGTAWDPSFQNANPSAKTQWITCPTTTFCATAATFKTPSSALDGTVTFFDGTAWSAPQTTGSTGLISVSCVDTTFCLASGVEDKVFQYDGTSWTPSTGAMFSTTTAATINVVNCPTKTFCMAANSAGQARPATGVVAPDPTPSATVTPSQTPSATPSATPSQTPSATPSATPSQTPSATPSATPSQTPSATPSATATATPSATPSATPGTPPSLSATPLVLNNPAGSSVVTVTGEPGQAVQLFAAAQPSTAPSVIRSSTLGADGKLAFTVPIRTNTAFFARTADGDSGRAIVKARNAVNLKGAVRGRTATFTGKVVPSRGGVTVRLYSVSRGTLTLVTSTRTNANGDYTIVRAFGAGDRSFLVQTVSDAVNLAGQSNRVALRLR